ncbi:hypothetical protein ACFLYS_01340 [Chloroflexota bacterium]
MSRFIKKLNREPQAELPPMGFGRSPKAPKPRMLLVAEVKAGAAEASKLAVGADAILLKDTTKSIKDTGDTPCGILLGKNGSLKTAAEAGVDFIAFPPGVPLEIVEDEEVGKILVIEASMERDLVKVIGAMPLDAVLVSGEEVEHTPFTWHHFMLLRGIAALCGKPLLLSIAADVGKDELQLLLEAGVAGVVVEAKNSEEIKELCRIIDSLKPPSKGKKGKIRAIVPMRREETTSVIEEDDEDIEEEED